MKKNPYMGKFIVFEGLDGSGLSTQAGLLRNFLIKKGYKVILTKEPTLNSEAGKRIRKILDKKSEVKPQKLQELFASDREQHLKNEILPALKKGKIVISDRYFFSSFAYGMAQGLPLSWLIRINSKFLLPDLTFILKVSPEICFARIHKRGRERTIFEEKEKLAGTYRNYMVFKKKFKNIKVVNGKKPINNIFSEIEKTLLKAEVL
jgi:dTMP kinase